MSAPALAVVGMSCRFPASPDLDAFWSLLAAGGDAIHDVSPDRWNLAALELANDGRTLPRLALRGGWLDRVRDFDPTFFRISPREARVMDPKQRLALEVAHEALQDAGLAPDGPHDRVGGCFMGTAQSEYLQRFFWRMEIGGERADRFVGAGNDPSFVCGRISGRFGLNGPSVNVNTACSTSLVAVHQAARAIQSGECDWALAGGVAIIESPEHSLTMDHFGLLSADSRCAAFDASGKGYVRAEGCGVVVLKRLDLAQADGDRIYAVVRGTAVNHIGRTDNVVVPTAESQSRLLRAALAVGDVPAETVDYVEAHGTGTAVGDPIEFHALRDVFGPGRKTPLTIGSLKTNVGHMEVAAGIGSFIKTALCLHHRQHVAHLHLATPNPGLQPTMPHRFPRALEPWASHDRPRRAAVNSFGLAGTNAAAILEEAPPSAVVASASTRPAEVITLSAYGEAPLRTMAAALAERVGAVPLATLARATRRRTEPHPIRAAIVARSDAEARDALRALAAGVAHADVRRGEVLGPAPKLGWLFTGQGSQYPGMGEALYTHNAVFRATIDEADAWLAPRLGVSLPALLWGDASARVHETQFTQPALFAFEIAAARALLALGLQPDALLGHSIGELAAAVIAGALSLEDGLSVVVARGALMGALPPGGAMAAVFASAEEVRNILLAHPDVDLASDNAPTSTVISGPAGAVAAVVQAFEARGVDARPLTVSHAFHSSLMDPALAAFGEVVAGVAWRRPAIPLISNLTGQLGDDRFVEPNYWVDHLRRAVRFREGVEGLVAVGATLLIEVGPDATLSGLARRTLPAGFPLVPMQRKDQGYAAWAAAVAELWCAGAPIAWDTYDDGDVAPWAPLPKYAYERRELWVEDPGPTGVLANLHKIGVDVGAATPSAAPGEQRAATDRAQAWRPRWDPIALPDATPLRPGRIVLGRDPDGLLVEVSALWRADGREVVSVDEGSDAAAAWRHALSAPGPIAGVVFPVPRGPDADNDPTEAAQSTGARAVAALAAHAGCLPDVPFWLLTRGGVAVRDGEAPDPVSAGIQSLVRVAVLEHPNTRWLRLDLDPAQATTARALATELSHAPLDEDQLAWRAGRLHALRLAPQPLDPASFAPRGDGAWLITGGTGGLGLAIAGDLLDAGVGRVVLAARSAPAPAVAAAIAALTGPGRRADFMALDVANASAVADVVRRLRADGTPLRGVVHGAGVLADAPLLKLDAERIARVLPPKTTGAWNLHRATLQEDLDAFVLMSSVTALLGAPGQGNYAIANGALDALAAQRQSRGLTALSVAWGPWAEVGMAAHLASLMASRGMGALRPADALPGLRGMIADGRPHLAYMDLRLTELAAAHPGVRRAPLFRRQFPLPSRGPLTPAAPDTAMPAAAAAPTVHAPSTDAVEDVIATEVARLLGVDAASVDRKRPLSWQGLDSVMAVDLQRALQDRLAVRVALDRLTVGPAVSEIASLAAALGASARPAAPAVTHVARVDAAPTSQPPTAATGSLDDIVAASVAVLLGVDAAAVDRKRPLSWQGLDSVMAVDLQRNLAVTLGVSLPLDRLTVGPAVEEIARLAQALGARVAPARPTPTSTAAAPSQQAGAADDVVADEVGRLLGVAPASLDRKRPLSWQGLDSVMAVDLQRALERRTGTRIALDRLTVGPSVAEIAAMLPAVAASTPAAQPASPPTTAASTDASAWLRDTLATLLGLPAPDIDLTRPLSWQGFDSVMAVDLQRAIERGQGVRLPLDRLVSGPRPDEVLGWLAQAQGEATRPASEETPPTSPVRPANDPLATAAAVEGPTAPTGNPLAWMLIGLGLVLGISWYVARTFAAIDPPARPAAQERAPTEGDAPTAPRKRTPKSDKAGKAEPNAGPTQ